MRRTAASRLSGAAVCVVILNGDSAAAKFFYGVVLCLVGSLIRARRIIFKSHIRPVALNPKLDSVLDTAEIRRISDTAAAFIAVRFLIIAIFSTSKIRSSEECSTENACVYFSLFVIFLFHLQCFPEQ